MIGDFNKASLSHKLLLSGRHVSKPCKAFAKN